MRLLIHCNGGQTLGVGHVVRSLALAEEAIASGHDVTLAGAYEGAFVRRQLEISGAAVRKLAASGPAIAGQLRALVDEIEPAILHLDTYDDVERPRKCGILLSNMEDSTYGRRRADVIIDPNFGADTEARVGDPQELHLRGSRYAPLRTVVTAHRGKWRLHEKASRVLVVMGGSDPRGLTPWVIDVLARTDLPLEVTAIVRPDARSAVAAVDRRQLALDMVEPVAHLPTLAVEHDLVVSAAGTSVWEFCCLGVPMALVCAVDNQRIGYERIINANAAVGLARSPRGAEVESASRRLRRILEDPAARQRLASRAATIVDEYGAQRVVRAWEKLAQRSP